MILILILTVAVLVLICIFGFRTRKIQVSGNVYYGEGTITNWIEKDPLSVNSLYLLGKYTFDKGELPSGVESLKVSFKNPWTVAVTVVEKSMLGYVDYDEAMLYFDEQGIATLRSAKQIEGVPYIEGLSFDTAEVEIGKVLPVAITILGGISVMNGNMSLGALVAYVEYSRNCTWPMEMMGWLTNDLSSAVASYKKIKKIYEVKPEIEDSRNVVTLDHVSGNVEFDHVSFKLDGKQILSDISFSVNEGKTLGIMGATGSGKSSIINMLHRFYDTTEGSVRLDGVDIRKISLRQLRRSVAVVLQDVFLFSDTIEENIKMGNRSTMQMDEIKSAAASAQASSFIEKMDEQYATVIGERGVGLSGGQKQRISIARAIAKKAPILILDDSTSALDMETEHEIQKTLNELKDTTKVIIAHRISAVCHADEIIYLKDGGIAERGTHQELLAKRGLYYETYMAQYGTFLGGEAM